MSAPLVSVIVPTYQRRASALEAVDCVFAQTYPAVELIVVDDGSTDGTSQALAGRDDLILLRQPHAGPAAARNRGLAVARGELVAPLDSDDLWDETFLEQAVGALLEHEADLVFVNWRREVTNRSWLDDAMESGPLGQAAVSCGGAWRTLDARAMREVFLASCPSPSSSLVLRRRSMPDAWSEAMSFSDDWYMLVEMALSAPCRAVFTTERLWTKRFDGRNRYEALPWATRIREDLHDRRAIQRELGHLLRPAERARWGLRRLDLHIELLRAMAPSWVDVLRRW